MLKVDGHALQTCLRQASALQGTLDAIKNYGSCKFGVFLMYISGSKMIEIKKLFEIKILYLFLVLF